MTTQDSEIIDKYGKRVHRKNGVLEDGDRISVKLSLALLWQIYSRCCFPPICLLQYGHR
jgi:hypothetical protein